MAFVSYITYEEYVNLGGEASETSFPVLERKSQRWLDMFTEDRIELLDATDSRMEIVKEVLAEFVNKLDEYSKQSEGGDVIEKYKNDAEEITYRLKTEVDVQTECRLLAKDWLPIELICKGVGFDAEKYLQPDNNNS